MSIRVLWYQQSLGPCRTSRSTRIAPSARHCVAEACRARQKHVATGHVEQGRSMWPQQGRSMWQMHIGQGRSMHMGHGTSSGQGRTLLGAAYRTTQKHEHTSTANTQDEDNTYRTRYLGLLEADKGGALDGALAHHLVVHADEELGSRRLVHRLVHLCASKVCECASVCASVARSCVRGERSEGGVEGERRRRKAERVGSRAQVAERSCRDESERMSNRKGWELDGRRKE
eukprot:194323-Rhodomonas_salina.1